ncbi:MAG: peptidoglycan-binding protein [bacterium]
MKKLLFGLAFTLAIFGIPQFSHVGHAQISNICSGNICIPVGSDPQNIRPIAVTSPNGGSLYKLGDNLVVTWNSSKLNPGTNLTIYLYSDQGVMTPFVFNVPSSWSTSTFNLDSTKINPGQYRVLIKVEPVVVNGGATHMSSLGINDVFDASDSTFTVGVNPDTTFTKDLAKGSVSPDVKSLQIFLISRGFLNISTPITTFGPATQTALIQYQKSKGITPANGKFNSTTRAQVIQDINYIPTSTGAVYNTLTSVVTGSGMNGGMISGSGQYASGTTAILTATTSLPTSIFTGWISGCTVSLSNPYQCYVMMDASKTVVASFGTTTPYVTYYPLTTSVVGSGAITGASTSTYVSGSTVTLTATSSDGSIFTGWGGACQITNLVGLIGSNTCTIVMDGPKSVTANFATSSTAYYTLTASTTGAGAGTVASTGGYSYASGTTATLTATAGLASVFNGWVSGCTPSLSNVFQCSVLMDGNKTVIAAFGTTSTSYYTLTASTTGVGSGTVTPGTASYSNGTNVTLTASPSSDSSVFTGWTGCTPVSTNPSQCSVLMDGSKTVYANFITVNTGDTTYKTLTTSVVGAGGVSTTDIGDITGTSISYASGTALTLTANITGTSSVFGWWTGCTSVSTSTSNAKQCFVVMNGDKNVVAHFVNSVTGTLPTTSSIYKRTLSHNNSSYGNDVKALQKFLDSKGFNVKVTSLFDRSTRNALMQYQQARGITPADGKFGPATRAVVIAETNSPTINPVIPITNATSSDPNIINDRTCYKITNSHQLIEMSCTSSEYLKLNRSRRVEMLKTLYILTPTVTTISPATGSISGLQSRYVKGTTATLTAVSGTNSMFSGWSGACSGTSTCSVVMDGPKYVTATFIPDTYAMYILTATSTGPGSITGLLSGYQNGSTATITAQPSSASSTFVGWSSIDSSSVCSNSTSNSCSILMNGNKSVIANFATTTASTSYSILVARVSGHGEVSNVNSSYVNGTTVYITAYPAPTAKFSYWSGACANPTSTVCAIVLDQNRTVVANFEDVIIAGNSISTSTSATTTSALKGDNVNTFDLVVSNGGTGFGSVTGGGNSPYTKGAKVTLTATADATSTFSGWSGACTNRSGVCKVVMKKATSVTANFTLKPSFVLTILTSGNGGGVVTGATSSASYVQGTQLELTATPNASSTLAGWTGPCINMYSGSKVCDVTMSKAKTITVKFKAK